MREDAEEEVKDRRGEDDDDEASAPPSKLALLQVRMCSIYFFLKTFSGGLFPVAEACDPPPTSTPFLFLCLPDKPCLLQLGTTATDH